MVILGIFFLWYLHDYAVNLKLPKGALIFDASTQSKSFHSASMAIKSLLPLKEKICTFEGGNLFETLGFDPCIRQLLALIVEMLLHPLISTLNQTSSSPNKYAWFLPTRSQWEEVPIKEDGFLVSFHFSSSTQFSDPPREPKNAKNFETSRRDLYSTLATRLILSIRVSREVLF